MGYQEYLPSIQADYIDQIFTLKSHKSLDFDFDKPTSTFTPDRGISEVTDLADYFDILISTSYNHLTETNKDLILDLYLNEYKADGLRKSFLFQHPVSSEYYIVKFLNGVSETLGRNLRHSYGEIKFLSIGTDRNLIQTSSWVAGNSTATGFDPIGGSLSYDSILDYDDILDYDEVL